MIPISDLDGLWWQVLTQPVSLCHLAMWSSMAMCPNSHCQLQGNNFYHNSAEAQWKSKTNGFYYANNNSKENNIKSFFCNITKINDTYMTSRILHQRIVHLLQINQFTSGCNCYYFFWFNMLLLYLTFHKMHQRTAVDSNLLLMKTFNGIWSEM